MEHRAGHRLAAVLQLPPTTTAIPRDTQVSQIPLRHLTATFEVFAANLYYWEP